VALNIEPSIGCDDDPGAINRISHGYGRLHRHPLLGKMGEKIVDLVRAKVKSNRRVSWKIDE